MLWTPTFVGVTNVKEFMNHYTNMKKNILFRKDFGQILVGTLLLMLLLLAIVPAVVQWVQSEARTSVKNQKSTAALNLAEAAVNRGYWKAKSSTGTFAEMSAGTPFPGYQFDKNYGDIPGGEYRILITSAANDGITIYGEGRDNSTHELREIEAIFQNETVYSPLLTQGNVSYSKGVSIFWGPIISQGNITLDNTTAQWYFPQKYARADVIGTAANPRDTSWPLPPNTDGIEWWANYPKVPELPILDFAALRSSAAATHTLNVYGCRKSSNYTDPTTGANMTGRAPWANKGTCPTGSPHYSSPTGGACYGPYCHFGNNWNHPFSPQYHPNTNYVWYWDGDVTFTGQGAAPSAGLDSGLQGTIIVRGKLTIDSGGDYDYTGHVPANAWRQHQKFTETRYDTPASGEYPADIGYHQSAATWAFGTNSFCFPSKPPNTMTCGWVNTVGVRGFTYVGGNLIIKNFMDFNGAVWVNGSVAASCPSGDPNCLSSFCGIFYNDQLQVPTLNVVLVQTDWQDTKPQSWP